VEAAAKLGGLRSIRKMQEAKSSVHYSVSGIDPNDKVTAANYLGFELANTLFKGFHELPQPLRQPEMLLRAVETLLANLISQKFNHSHEILDQFCEHVHMSLSNIEPDEDIKH